MTLKQTIATCVPGRKCFEMFCLFVIKKGLHFLNDYFNLPHLF